MAATAVDASTGVQATSKVPSPTKLRFSALDVKSSDGVAKVVPFMDKENAKKMIPIHIRASSGNPRAVLLAMEGYRRMTGTQQQKEHQTWRDMSPAEQRRFKSSSRQSGPTEIVQRRLWANSSRQPTIELFYRVLARVEASLKSMGKKKG